MNKTEDPPMAKPRPICNPMPAVAKGRAPAQRETPERGGDRGGGGM
jgi:hypothetical protein